MEHVVHSQTETKMWHETKAFDTIRRRLAEADDYAPALYLAALADPSKLCHPVMVRCRVWPAGFSRGRPVARLGKRVGHPVKLYFGPDVRRITRVCRTDHCVNPFHYAVVPKPPATLQHPLILEAEQTIDQFRSLAEAIEGIDIPAHYVIQAYRNQRTLNLKAPQ